ncbi:MAG: ATP-binding protein [Anaerolineales bacterium]|nr:ATP-binding protein [Anaerolineales bacterium]
MPKKIDETLKKLAETISKASSPTSSNAERLRSGRSTDLIGDPNCPICGGLGYYQYDLPLGHPDFGKLQPCDCRRRDISQQVLDRLYALSNLSELRHLTFESFQPQGRIGLAARQVESLEQAFNQARRFSERPNGWLVLQGGYGCGKTHLAAAIANFAVSLGLPTLFLTVPDLLDALRYTYDDPQATFEERFEQIRTAGLLVLDDFGTQNATAWAQEKLFQIVNYRYINRLPTVVTTNLALDQIEGRIRSRLEDPELVSLVRILASDYRRPAGDFGHHELSSLDLMHEMTFESFDLRKNDQLPADQQTNLQNAFRTAQAFARKPDGWLVYTGAHGSGKTHLAAAIGNYRLDQGEQVIFVSVPEMLDELRATFSAESNVRLDQRFEEYKTAPLLILDDLGTQSSTPWAREKLYQLFNYRYFAKLPTVITTFDQIEAIDARLLSRMLDTRLCTLFAILAPDYRGGGPARQAERPSNSTPARRKTKSNSS